MKIISCHIENFGRLCDLSLRFEDGLTLILEENGWGKSTLAAFVTSMFYGLPAGSRKKGADGRSRWLPWNGGVCGGSLLFETGGRSYRIMRTFGTTPKQDTFLLYDARTGYETGDFSEQTGAELFGIDRLSFLRTAFISSGDSSSDPATPSVQAKISGIAREKDDLLNYDAAMGRIRREAGRLSPGRSSGALYGMREQMETLIPVAADTDHAREAASSAAAALAEERDRLAHLEVSLEENIRKEMAENDRLKESDQRPSQSSQDLQRLRRVRAALRKVRRRERALSIRLRKEQERRTAWYRAALLTAAAAAALLVISLLLRSAAEGRSGGGYSVLFCAAAALCAVCAACSVICTAAGRLKGPSEETVSALAHLSDKKRKLKKMALELQEEELQEEDPQIEDLQRREENVRTIDERQQERQPFLPATAGITAEIRECRQRIPMLSRDLDEARDRLRSCEEAETKLEALRGSYTELQERYRTCVLASRFLQQAYDNLAVRCLDPFRTAFLKYYRSLEDAGPDSVMTDASLSVAVMEQGLPRDPEVLSEGTRELIGFCRHMAMLEAMYPGDRPFLILDDPFAGLDDRRLRAAGRLLQEISSCWQILYLTCHTSRVF